MLEISNCTAGYDGNTVLDSVSLSVPSGKTGCIVGPSGCGKTTLLTVAAGLKKADRGTATLDGEVIAAGDRRVGLIIQQYGLFPWFTAIENAALGLRIRGCDERSRQEKARGELERVGLGDLADRYPFQLSGGQQQRVAIARSLALAPRLLLMDEPFSALDAMSRESLQDSLLSSLGERKLSVLLVTHSIEEAVYLGSTVWLLAGTPGTLLASWDNPLQGSAEYREEPAFFEMCTKIRHAMKMQKAL
ncbi:MAG: ABC transporter ATP-binding protein [Spirochaetia bacterium]|jgi:NitT/TauT family transport system ATP-binding protein